MRGLYSNFDFLNRYNPYGVGVVLALIIIGVVVVINLTKKNRRASGK